VEQPVRLSADDGDRPALAFVYAYALQRRMRWKNVQALALIDLAPSLLPRSPSSTCSAAGRAQGVMGGGSSAPGGLCSRKYSASA
jgi:uncharacterized membrane protein